MNFENPNDFDQKEYRPFDDPESLLLILSVLLFMIDERIEGRQMFLEILAGLSFGAGAFRIIVKALKSW